MRIKILGKIWRFRFAPNMAIRGDCEPPTKVGKQIRVSSSLKGEERLEVIIHEMIHAAGWHLDEEYVHDFARDVARALWRLGYRQQTEKER